MSKEQKRTEPSEIDKLKVENSELKKLNAELLTEVEKLSERKVVAALPTIEVEGKTYELTVPKFQYNQVIYTAENLSAEVVKELVEGGHTVLKLVE